MFTIDLLKGRGVPIKSGPERILVGAVGIVVPVIASIVMVGLYLSSRAAISVHSQAIIGYETKTQRYSDAVELRQSFERQKQQIDGCMSEVSSAIGRHAQWSQILMTLAKNMPDSMVLMELEVKQDSTKIKVPKKDDPTKTVDITVPVRTLVMSVRGNSPYSSDKAVRDFRKRLRTSPVLGPKLENIVVDHKVDKVKGQDVVSYEIGCIFKPGS